jgi:hypothetical protein
VRGKEMKLFTREGKEFTGTVLMRRNIKYFQKLDLGQENNVDMHTERRIISITACAVR